MKKSRRQLLIATSAREAWEGAIRPWFEEVAPSAWKNSLPSVVVVPTRGQANFLREKSLGLGGSYLGLHFVTPMGLRKFLALESSEAAAEDLRLLLALAATEIEHEAEEPDALAAKAVARAPAYLLRSLQRLAVTGWDFDQLQLPSFRRIIRRFRTLLEACQFPFPGNSERLALTKAEAGSPRFAHLLITGFDGAHWPHWFLLGNAVALAENATIILEEPRADLAEVDLCWIGSWEENIGAATPVAGPALTRGESFFSEAEMRGEKQPTTRFDFLIGLNVFEQAEAITQQCLRYLSEEKCARLGVIFPGNGALPRLVADALARRGIPHNDGLAHIVPGIFESAEWQAWLALQRAPRLHSFLRFLQALRDPVVLSPNLSRTDFEKILRETYDEILLDDLEVLRASCAARADDKFQAVADALRDLVFLPSRATLAQFLEQTQLALAQLNWKQHALEITNASRGWPQRLDLKFSRALFLRWLEETAATFGAARGEMGEHPYARVHLLGVAHAQNQDWSHLIFAGWNEGAWPPPADAEFAREEEIRSFNRSVQRLNKRAARQGRQGEGHTSIRGDHSLYLGPAEQRAIALRQFDVLLESASEAITLTASLVQEDAPERFWNPSECLAQLYFKKHALPLTQTALKNLRCSTAQWLDASRPRKQNEKRPAPEVAQTLVAFKARRDTSKPAGEYDFALRAPGDYRPTPTLSVSDLQGMVSSPAIVWMKRYLAVEAEDDAANPWPAATGKWVHRWLARIAPRHGEPLFARFPTSTEIDAQIGLSANENLNALQQLCDSLGKRVPDWWHYGWLNARYLARHLGEKISRVEGWSWMAAELPIGRAGMVKIADEIELQLRGQIDLVLAQNEAADFSGGNFWIVDYKTGSTKELRAGDLHDSLVKGTSLQLGLYSLAVRALGAATVGVSIISSAIRNIAPQLQVADLEPHREIFRDLAQMQRTGIFGMKGDVRPAFGFSTPYPLATLPIDPDLLDDKWALTHPALVLEKEEWEIW